jgi:hypothetical protein
MFGLECIDFEAEGVVAVLGPEVLGAVPNVLVEVGIVCSGAPEFVDAGAQDGAGDKSPCGCF